MSETEVHESLLQCHFGSASVKTLMNVCCASNTHANDTRMAWRSWASPNSPIQRSMVSSREGGCFDSFEESGRERRSGVESAIL
jgi:hypothetical protein